jgi:septum formation protein
MPAKNKWKLILASSSPRRKELLAFTGVPFTIETKNVEEFSSSKDPRQYSLDIAAAKGLAVSSALDAQDSLVVISADTVVEKNGVFYGKPKDRKEAEQFLIQLSGTSHSVHTAVVLLVAYQGQWRRLEHVETTKVRFHKINERLLSRYLDSGDSLDKAGGYGIQGQALTFIADISGCYANVVGFPIAQFCLMMENDFRSLIGGDKPWQDYF